MTQIELHNRIDEMLSKAPEGSPIQAVSDLISKNSDAKQYFYTKADDNWLNFLWKNGFLDVIKEKAEDPTRYGYRTPELNYLVRVAEKKPAEVVDIMLSVEISKDNFNPEVVDQFLRICGSLPAENLARMVVKIRDGKWVQLMSVFNDWGFEYEKMFATLAENKKYDSLLVLVEAVLAVKTKEDFNKNSQSYLADNPFYFKDLSYTKVFEHLVNVDNENAEKALELAGKAMSEIIKLGDEKSDKKAVFDIEDMFSFYDVDFFTLDLKNERLRSDRENAKELAASIKKLAQKLIGDNCQNTDSVISAYDKCFQNLPSCRSMWRLQLYVMSLCPNAFQNRLKQVFLRLFEVMEAGKNYYEIESGTEYKKALKKSFGTFDSDYQREFIANVFQYFGKSLDDKKEEQWHKRDGWQILSSICDFLTEGEKNKCEEIFGNKCDSKFTPETSIGTMRGGTVSPRGAISQEEFNKLTIVGIIGKLKNEWKPDVLHVQNTHDDFLNPLNAEGVGSQLRTDIAKRLQDYLANSSLFFDRDVLDEHYTYSFFRGIQEAIKVDKTVAKALDWDNLIEIMVIVVKSGKEKPFDYEKRERETYDSWLASWSGVHSSMTDVLQELLNENEGQPVIDFDKYRDKLFDIIEYLLSSPDPEPKDEELETAVSKTRLAGDKEEYQVTDPFTMAINTVRGRAFQAFVLFVYQDGKQFSKEDNVKIKDEVKAVYETVLRKENTRALMFMFGHYLPSFYFRDKDWIHGLLPQIFPADSEKQHLYLASWEGYLANNLYEEIFFVPEFQKLYERGLGLTGDEDSNRRYFKDPDEGIAVHVALAFIVYHSRFGFDDELFKKFWAKDVERQADFISFIGRMFVSGDNARANEQLSKDAESRERLVKLWEWVLENHTDPKMFESFGFWINFEKNLFDPEWLAVKVKETLNKTQGALDWDYALVKNIDKLAEASPADTLEITRLFLLEGGVRGKKMRMPFIYDDVWVETLRTLYNASETKKATYTLIDDLIREGGSLFWEFKNIIEKK